MLEKVTSTPSGDVTGTGNLAGFPTQATLFVGREAERIALSARLQDPDCRLLTVLGPGGIGKTRLAEQVAREQTWRNRSYFVALAGTRTVELLVPTLADALGFAFYGKHAPLQQVLNYLEDKQLLLVLDSFEHLLDGVGVLIAILEHAPQVKLLVTSRERLNIQQEWAYEIGGLPYPAEPEAHGDYPARTLFLHNARRLYAGYAPSEQDEVQIHRICRLVDGMPLALELASAWVRMLSCQEIADGIARGLTLLAIDARDRLDRHRSIYSAFDQSWHRLSKKEQQVFRRLSVFQGGFRTEAAERVVNADLATLAALVDKSLVIGGPSGRYSMHDLLHQYAGEKAQRQAADAARIKAEHSAYYLSFLARQKADLKGRRQQDAMQAIRDELGNVRAAWQWAVRRADVDSLDAALETLSLFFELDSRFEEGLALLDEAAPASATDSRFHCRLLSRRGNFRRVTGHYEAARDLLRQSLAEAETAGLTAETAFACLMLAVLSAESGDPAESEKLTLRCIDLYQQLGDRWGEARAYHHLAYGSSIQGLPDNQRAQQLYQQAADTFRDLGDRSSLTRTLSNLGWIIHVNGDSESARDVLEDSLVASRQIGYKLGTARALDMLGMVTLWGLHDPNQARGYLEQSLAIRRDIGEWPSVSFTLNNLADIAYQQQNYPEARRLYRESLGLAERIQDLRGIALAVGGLGDVSCVMGEYETSLEHFRQSFQIALDSAPGITLILLYSIGMLFQAMGFRDAAIALFALLLHHPLSPPGLREQAAQRVEGIAPSHPAVEALRRDPAASAAFIRRHIAQIAKLLGASRRPFDEWLSGLAAESSRKLAQPGADRKDSLSERELDVLRLMGEGCSNAEIAERLVIGKGTVKTHTLNIYRKLSVNNRTQAIIRARKLDIL
ncbi:MAG: tetratricopeptide repeat protein [Anaerolineae bacterium]|nr:tetratricopeptide repeat protein [Anaerolineae bacterium]